MPPGPDDRADDALSEYRRKRDFKVTREPAGRAKAKSTHKMRRAVSRDGPPLQFVIQKHDATTLHFDLRLEVDGVMKSWAVPRGLSLDPANKRLAMEVEDHPLEYNEFEGTIPKGEYGGGTVMIWDRGTYFADEAEEGEDDEAAMRRGHEKGKISFFLEGERLRGSFALVRTDAGPKPKWLAIKHRDEYVDREHDPVDEIRTSVVTGRTLDEIAAEEAGQFSEDSIAPMLPVEADVLPEEKGWVFEEYREGPRVLAYITPEARTLISSDRSPSARFRDIAEQLGALAERTGRSFVLDGTISNARETGLAYIVSDILYDDGDVMFDQPWRERRARIASLFSRRRLTGVRLAEVRRAHGKRLVDHAEAEGWSGIIAKREASLYIPGQQSDDWRLLPL